MALRITPLIIACALLGAHFFRSGNSVLVGLCAVAPLLLLVRARWSLWVLQAGAYCATLVWVLVAFELIRRRMLFGAPWARLAVIIFAVAVFTAVAGALLNTRALRERYPKAHLQER